mmetsp:Transcript_6282/g.18359  ORF Transcript_6282/g.18359 Transcript_6282/m.18359 type:complete len:351 (+) Transcript_6282:612-1664(+)
MGRHDIRPADGADPAVCRKDDDGGEGGFQSTVQVREALDVQHVDLVDEQNAGNEFGDTLVDVPVHNPVDLRSQLLGDFCLLGLHHLAHHGQDILATLGPGVGHVQVVERHVLDDLLLLVHVSLGQGHVLLRLKIKLCRVGVGSPDALHRPARGFNVDHISHGDLLLLDGLVDLWVETKRLAALGCLESNLHVRNRSAVASERILRLLRCELGDLALVDFFILLYPQPNGAAKVLHENLGLLHLGGVHLGANHGAERDLGAQLLGNAQCQGGLASARGSSEEQRAPRHLFGLDQVHHNTTCLAGLLLSNEASGDGDGGAVLVQSQALDVGVHRDALRSCRALDFFDLHGGG